MLVKLGLSFGMMAGRFEHTIAVKKGKADILSTFEHIEEVLNKV
jgi:hypothetical protein